MAVDSNALKAQIRQKIQERILASSVPKEDYSVGGFFKNVGSEASSIVRGVGALIGLAGKSVIHPIETAQFLASKEFDDTLKQVGSSVVESYKGYKDPLNKLYKEPISVVTDALTALSLGGAGLTKVGTAAKLPAVTKAGEIASAASKPITLGKNVATSAITKLPGGPEFLTALEQRAKTIDVLSKAQRSHLIERNKSLQEVDSVVASLTPEEQQTLIPFAQGTVDLAFQPSENFTKAVSLVQKLAQQREDIVGPAGLGKLTAQQIENRKWQPIIKQLYGDEALSGNVTEKVSEAKSLLGFSKNPTYVQHIFNDKPKKFTDFFINSAPVKSWKPGFLKKSYGVSGYSIDPNEVLKWQTVQTLKYKNNVDLLEKVKNLDFVEPLDDIKNLKPGYKVFAPDGYIRFYQGTIDLVKEFSNKIKGKSELNEVSDIWDDLKSALDSSLLEKKYVGVTNKVKLYQVPDASAKILQAYAKTVNPYVRLFWDKPVDAFRFLALALTPRWLVNNVVGNTVFSVIAGDPFSPSGYLTYRAAREQGLIPDDVFSGFYSSEKLMSGKLGKAAETKLGALLSSAGETAKELPIIKQVGQLGDLSYRINSAVDDFFRGAHFINEASRLARKKVVAETGEKLKRTIDLLKYAKQDEEILAKAINSVDDFFYGAGSLSPFERQYVRRFLPFYSWYKFITLYSLRLPLNHPARFEVINNLAKTFYDLTGQNELPNYLKGSIPIGESKEGDIYYLRTSGTNPFGLLEDIATQGVSQTALSGLTPGAKTAVERLTGREAFSGRTYTAKDIIETYGGRLYTFNPQTGKVEEVEGKVLPSTLEHLLRNFVPQYQLLEQAIAGGAQTYTSAGLPSLISGDGIKKSPITGEPKQPAGAKQRLMLRAVGLAGLPISMRTQEQEESEAKAIQGATTQIIGQEAPALSSQFKRKLKEELKNKIMNDVKQRSIIEGIY